LALFQPDIPQNTGTILRLAACMALPVDIIRPAGFDISDRALRRATMDYGTAVEITLHDSWQAFAAFLAAGEPTRIVAATTAGAIAYTEFVYMPSDVLLFGRESAGLPEAVHAVADARIRIPMQSGMRSLNVAMSAAMITGEALRQTEMFAPCNEANSGNEH